jgi:hypothetical protein
MDGRDLKIPVRISDLIWTVGSESNERSGTGKTYQQLGFLGSPECVDLAGGGSGMDADDDPGVRGLVGDHDAMQRGTWSSRA